MYDLLVILNSGEMFTQKWSDAAFHNIVDVFSNPVFNSHNTVETYIVLFQ